MDEHGVEPLCFNQSLSGIDSQKRDKIYINTTSNKRDKPFSAYFHLSNVSSVQFTLKMRLIFKHQIKILPIFFFSTCWGFSPKIEEIYRVLVERLCNWTILDQKMVCTRVSTIRVRDVFLNKQINPPKNGNSVDPGNCLN